MSSRSRHAILMLCCLSLQGVGCGYRLGAFHANDVRTVAVPIFESDADRRGIEYQITEAVQQEIKTRTPYKLAKEPFAETRLRGKVISVRKRPLGETRFDDPRELQYTLMVEVVWEDLRTGAILAEQTIPVETSSLALEAQADFAPEVGQSQAVATQKAVEKIATQIVDRMETPW